jgi:hypothetical protein
VRRNRVAGSGRGRSPPSPTGQSFWCSSLPPGRTSRLLRTNPHSTACTYSLTGEREPIRATVTYGVRSNQLRVLLMDVDRGTVVERLVIEEPDSRRWSYERFVPMEPAFELKQER